MTKVLIKSLATIALSTLSFSASAALDYCSKNSCWFWTLNKSQNQTLYFHCAADPHVTHVEFENHNVSVSGFVKGNGPLAGTLTLEGREEVAELETYYFVVSDDHLHNHFDPRTVTFKANGQFRCEIGQGGHPRPYS